MNKHRVGANAVGCNLI